MLHVLAILLATLLNAVGTFLAERHDCANSAMHKAMCAWTNMMLDELLIMVIHGILWLFVVLK